MINIAVRVRLNNSVQIWINHIWLNGKMVNMLLVAHYICTLTEKI